MELLYRGMQRKKAACCRSADDLFVALFKSDGLLALLLMRIVLINDTLAQSVYILVILAYYGNLNKDFF